MGRAPWPAGGHGASHPLRFFVGLVAVSAVVYVPLALAYTPWAWSTRGRFVPAQPAAALSRLFLRRLCGRRLWPRARPLGRRPSGAALGRMARRGIRRLRSLGAPTSLTLTGARRPWSSAAAGLGFVVACAAGCFSLLAVCLRFAPGGIGRSTASRPMPTACTSSTTSLRLAAICGAGLGLFAIGKAAIVFGGTLVMSWAMAVATGGSLPVSPLMPRLRGVRRPGTAELERDRFRSHAAGLHARVPKPVSRSAALHRDRHRHRFLHRAGDGADGPLSRLRAHGHDDDRPCVGRPLDHAARHQVLRGPVAAGYAKALSRAVGQRRGGGDSGGDRIRGLADAERLVDTGVRGRFGFAVGRICSPGTWSKAASRRSRPRERVAVDRSYFDRLGISGRRRHRRNSPAIVRVAAVTNGIRSFTTTPYVFMDVDRARAYTGARRAKPPISGQCEPGTEHDHVRSKLRAKISDVEVLTTAEFRDRSRSSGCSAPAPARLCSPARCSA